MYTMSFRFLDDGVQQSIEAQVSPVASIPEIMDTWRELVESMGMYDAHLQSFTVEV